VRKPFAGFLPCIWFPWGGLSSVATSGPRAFAIWALPLSAASKKIWLSRSGNERKYLN